MDRTITFVGKSFDVEAWLREGDDFKPAKPAHDWPCGLSPVPDISTWEGVHAAIEHYERFHR